ncbi:MAG: lipoate--protein ligase [Bacteroidales bacterium]|jgi:lipoate-protein ligase A|nr:lipoate--protein ligase [Bacteroidales bacterium]
MLIINSPSNFPPFNIATEEYLIKNFSDDIFLLYINEPTIIVGINQNTLAEINLEYIKATNINVVRRLSGGGAVFHDLGNLNFSFITNISGNKKIDFRKYTQPIINAMQNIGINAEFEGRNDLTIDKKKFSGNASHIYKNRICHHGTLLFDTDLTRLSKSLNPKEDKFEGKAVKSVKSRVTNIKDYLKENYTIEEFTSYIINQVIKDINDAEAYKFSEKDTQSINLLVENKYNTWEWNFGKSPKYNFNKSIKTSAGRIELYIYVEKGLIKEISIYGDFFGTKPVKEFTDLLIGKEHKEDDIISILEITDVNDYFSGFEKEDLKSLFF